MLESDSSTGTPDHSGVGSHLRIKLESARRAAPNASAELTGRALLRPMSRRLAEGLYESVVLECASGTRAVTQAEIGSWPFTAIDVFDIARNNVRIHEPCQVGDFELEGFPFKILWDPIRSYAAAHVNWLEDIVDVGPIGAIVAFPTPATVLVHPVRARTWCIAMAALQGYVSGVMPGGSAPLTPHVYVWRDGRLRRGAVSLSGDGQSVTGSWSLRPFVSAFAASRTA